MPRHWLTCDTTEEGWRSSDCTASHRQKNREAGQIHLISTSSDRCKMIREGNSRRKDWEAPTTFRDRIARTDSRYIHIHLRGECDAGSNYVPAQSGARHGSLI
jgi:hypothetical protein